MLLIKTVWMILRQSARTIRKEKENNLAYSLRFKKQDIFH